MAVFFEMFLVLAVMAVGLSLYGYTKGSVAAFLSGIAITFFLAMFIGTDGLAMLDGTVLTATNSLLIKTLSESVIMVCAGVFALTMVVLMFYRE